MNTDDLDYGSLARIAHKPALNSEGIVVLPADWNEENEQHRFRQERQGINPDLKRVNEPITTNKSQSA